LSLQQQRSPSGLLLLNLSATYTLVTAAFLALSAPTLWSRLTHGQEEELKDEDSLDSTGTGGSLCHSEGAVVTFGHPLAAWNTAAIHVDRFVSIAYPLR